MVQWLPGQVRVFGDRESAIIPARPATETKGLPDQFTTRWQSRQNTVLLAEHSGKIMKKHSFRRDSCRTLDQDLAYTSSPTETGPGETIFLDGVWSPGRDGDSFPPAPVCAW